MKKVLICPECGEPVAETSLEDALIIHYTKGTSPLLGILITYEYKETGALFKQAWHRRCFLAYENTQKLLQEEEQANEALAEIPSHMRRTRRTRYRPLTDLPPSKGGK
jgi:hypothetical protein